MDKWRLIETAPKKPGTVLGVVDGRVRLISYCKTSHVPFIGWNLADQGAEDFELCEPTHWMPLPEPPAPYKNTTMEETLARLIGVPS